MSQKRFVILRPDNTPCAGTFTDRTRAEDAAVALNDDAHERGFPVGYHVEEQGPLARALSYLAGFALGRAA